MGKSYFEMLIESNSKKVTKDLEEVSEFIDKVNKQDITVYKNLAKDLDELYKSGKKVLTQQGELNKRFKVNKAIMGMSPDEIQLVLKSFKEIGGSSEEITKILIKLANYIPKAEEAIEHLGEAYWKEAVSTEHANEINERFQEIIESTKEKVDELTESTENLAEQTKEVSKSTEEVARELTLVEKVSNLLIKNNDKLDAQQRDLRFTNSLYEGMFQSMRKIINSTKILSGAVNLLSSAFGYIIDMIFLPLLPIAVSLAEFLFGVGDAINTVLDFITGINPGIAQLISFITLATGAALLFLGGQFISGTPGITLLFGGALNAIKDTYNTLKENAKYGDSQKGWGHMSSKTPEGTKGQRALAKALPAAATVGAAGAGLAIGTGIVSAMQLTGAVDVLSSVGSATGIQNIMHNKALDFIPGVKQFKTTLEGAGDITNFLQESVLGYFAPDFNVRLATTKNVVDRALKEGMYSPQVEAYLNSEFGEGTFHYAMGDESLGFERGWYNSMGDKVTSYSSAQSSSITYNNNYNNTVSNAGFNLFNIAGL